MKIPDSFALHTLHTLLSVLEESISIVNTKGEMVYWNEAAEKTFHIKKEEIIGRNVTDFFREEDVMNLKVLKSKQPVHEKYHQPLPDQHVVISTTPIYDENNQLIGSMSVERDISTTIRLNENLSNTLQELQHLKQQLSSKRLDDAFSKIKGNSQAINRLIYDAKKAAKSDATVLITGESGSGKELFAQAIHQESSRSKKAFIPINCGAIPQALFESELFGYEAGAYTGASNKGKPGKMELAKGGTLFLDEVGELPLNMQVKLLRALQEKEIYRIGGQTPKKINVRIIAATNRHLENMVSEGTFRSDLYYRLNVFATRIPSLRERIEDLPCLVYEFLEEFSSSYNKPLPSIHKEALNRLCEYHWPGNIRELRNLFERLMVLHEHSEISEMDITQLLPQAKQLVKPLYTVPLSLKNEKESIERERILQTLEKTYGNKSISAKELGMSRATLYKKMKKYGIGYES
ncbi:sigma 54-interacting transcriptional regulator [Bacillus sp. FJAT-49705]|uniref:Sigma 54-interacting transcriptional regulator n=1 Tax=Cytobacillus citreus TaxID=2833586 RepID=A0ABS5NY68_9BACI|nr:sigma 54-interacting transcriptional regulator [Cytobacillus citreus]MBS4192778.1 sigma 54-interacting transcriptional regulator [Cytobacillus citreus]